MAEQTSISRGMKFPMQINPATGRVMTSSEAENVKESVYLILMTAVSERLLRPEFGTNMNQYLFMEVNQTTLNIMTRELSQTILNQEPRISSVQINPIPDLDNGRLIIQIDYVLLVSGETGNILFPFYLNPDEKDEEPYEAETEENR